MKHLGPDPSEALQPGEETLSPDETALLADVMFTGEESRREFFGEPDDSNLSPRNKAAIDEIRREMMDETVEAIKQGIIEHRSSEGTS